MRRTPSVEIRIPVSPTREFALMLAVLYHSLKTASSLDEFRLTVIIGAPPEDLAASATLADWLRPEMEAVIVDPDAVKEYGIHAAAALRLKTPTDAGVMICMDADMVAVGDLTDIVLDLVASPAVAGVVAHVPPLCHEEWGRMYAHVGAGRPSFPYRYTGPPSMWPMAERSPDERRSPAYFNFGFVAMPAAILRSIREHYWKSAEGVVELFPENMFRSQIALTLAIEKAGVPHRAIGMRYNFPNDFRLEAAHSDEFPHVRLIHLLRRGQGFDKQEIYRDIDSLREFASRARQTADVLERAREMVGEALPEVEAKPLPDELAPSRWLW